MVLAFEIWEWLQDKWVVFVLSLMVGVFVIGPLVGRWLHRRRLRKMTREWNRTREEAWRKASRDLQERYARMAEEKFGRGK